jgi:hypothetical protein
MSLAGLGKQQSLGTLIAYTRPRGAVPSVTARGARRRGKPVNDVGESSFAAIVDRHYRQAGSGDYR